MLSGNFYESGVFLMQNFDSSGKAIRRITGMVAAGLSLFLGMKTGMFLTASGEDRNMDRRSSLWTK